MIEYWCWNWLTATTTNNIILMNRSTNQVEPISIYYQAIENDSMDKKKASQWQIKFGFVASCRNQVKPKRSQTNSHQSDDPTGKSFRFVRE